MRWIWSQLLNKTFMENFIFYAMQWSNTCTFVSNKDPARLAHFVSMFPFTSTFSNIRHYLLYNAGNVGKRWEHWHKLCYVKSGFNLTGRDSRRGFEFSRLNSLLSRAFSRRDKNHWNYKWMWHLNKIKVALTLWTLNYVDCVPFSCIHSFHIVLSRANEI